MPKRTTGKSHSPGFCILSADLVWRNKFQVVSQPSSFDPFSSALSLAKGYINDILKIKRFLLICINGGINYWYYKCIKILLILICFTEATEDLKKWFMSILKNNEILAIIAISCERMLKLACSCLTYITHNIQTHPH